MAGQCSILYINTDGVIGTHASALRALGFEVVETDDVPARDTLANHHAIVIRMKQGRQLASVAARLRAAPLFGRRDPTIERLRQMVVESRSSALDVGVLTVTARADPADALRSEVRAVAQPVCTRRPR